MFGMRNGSVAAPLAALMSVFGARTGGIASEMVFPLPAVPCISWHVLKGMNALTGEGLPHAVASCRSCIRGE